MKQIKQTLLLRAKFTLIQKSELSIQQYFVLNLIGPPHKAWKQHETPQNVESSKLTQYVFFFYIFSTDCVKQV